MFQLVCSGFSASEVACNAASPLNFLYRQLFSPKDFIVILSQNGYTGVGLTFFPPFCGCFEISTLLAGGLTEVGKCLNYVSIN